MATSNTQKKLTIWTIFKQKGVKQAIDNVRGFGRGMAATLPEMQEAMSATGNWDKSMRASNTAGGRLALTVRKMTHGMKGFNMEMLGIMFFGMAITRTMGGLISKSMEWLGVMEILSTALGILFLPVAEKLLGWALKFLDWVDSLTESQKKLYGKIVLIAAIFGIVLTVIGTLALGIGSLILVFGQLAAMGPIFSGMATTITSAFAGLALPIIAIIAIIIAVVAGMYMAWKSNFLGMKAIVATFVSGLKLFFGGIIQFFKGFMQIVIGLFTGDFTKVAEGIKNVFGGLWDFLVGGFKIAFSAIAAVIVGALKIAYNIIKTIVDSVGWLIGAIGGKLGIGSGGSAFSMPAFKTGGIVPGRLGTPVPVIAHAGERITPANRVDESKNNSGTQNITINAAVSNDYDVRRMADKLKQYWVNDFEKTSQGRSI